ncbi:MAG: DNA (cytosine-5-)-methyltransferase [Clostridia bacterium]|nr:DNA (cytosine-5-)-methyltransferase [Clostridia bacterium]
MNKLKVLELFGGIGACSKALERLGIDYEIADYVEIDKYAVKSFNAIHNTNFEPQDITQWDKDIEVDLIMHGSPCQDFSLAGKQAGGNKDSGTRSSLMYETIRIVEKLKPKYVIWENVKNLLSKKHRHNFDAYLETMEQLGYTNYYQVLNAKDYGIPQNRERVFTISILGSKNYEFPAKEELKTTMHDLLEENVEEKYYLSENMTKYVTEKNEKSNFKVFRPHYAGEEKIAHTIQTSGGNRADDNFIVFHFPPKQELKLKLKDMLEDEVEEKYYLSEEKILKIANWKAYQKPFEKVQGKNSVVPTLTARGAGEEHSGMITYCEDLEDTTNLQPIIIGSTQKHAAISTDGIVPTLTSSMGMGGGHVPMHNYDLRIRKLTPKECWRLMGFDDIDVEKASKINSNTQLYKQAGNSIVVNVLEAILNNLLKNN